MTGPSHHWRKGKQSLLPVLRPWKILWDSSALDRDQGASGRPGKGVCGRRLAESGKCGCAQVDAQQSGDQRMGPVRARPAPIPGIPRRRVPRWCSNPFSLSRVQARDWALISEIIGQHENHNPMIGSQPKLWPIAAVRRRARERPYRAW